MGRRTKLLKPHSWGAADICLFSGSSSLSLTRRSYLSPHFTGLILSACLRMPAAALAPSCCFIPSHPPPSVCLPLFSSVSCSSSFFFSSVKASREPRAQSDYVERICIILPPESVCNHHSLLPSLCDEYLTIMLHLRGKNWLIIKLRRGEGYFSRSRGGASFHGDLIRFKEHTGRIRNRWRGKSHPGVCLGLCGAT